MTTISRMYNEKCRASSDINEHLPTLFKYAKDCSSIAEFGVRSVVSSWAFANARPDRLTCVDIVRAPEVDKFIEICKREGQTVDFILGSTLDIEIPEVDMLFIDTLHDYEQLKSELARHHSKVHKYILMHDIVSFGHNDESNPNGRGLVPAINEFVESHKDEWRFKEIFTNNNGLCVLSRVC